MSISVTKAMLMSAGMGTRLMPFTQTKTKALLPLMGIPMAQYVVDSLTFCGVDCIVANVHHDAKNTRFGLNALELGSAQLVISDESQQLLGSGGGIRKALNYFGSEPFFRANADVISDINWKALANRHGHLRSQWGVTITLALFESGPPGDVYREIFFDSYTGLITGLGELHSGRPFFAGAAVLEPEALAGLNPHEPSDFINDVLKPALRAQKVGFFLTTGAWYDIGSPLLWMNTHLSLIERLETGNFSTQISRLWMKRIEKTNQRLSEKIWVMNRSSRFCPSNPRHTWQAPCYWGEISQEGDTRKTPLSLGPHAVLYGPLLGRTQFQNGIGYAGDWVSF